MTGGASTGAAHGTPEGQHNRLFLAGSDQPTSWAALPVLDLPAWAEQAPVALLAEDSSAALAAVWHHVRTRAELLLVAAARVDQQLRDELEAAGFAVVTAARASLTTHASATARAGQPGRLWLLTSGSTGRPKRVEHSLDTLTTVRAAQPPRTWLCPYSPGTYAWWQLITLSLRQPGQHLVTVDPSDIDDWPALAAAASVEAVSATPTFWRRAIYQDSAGLAKLRLAQITLGGEPVDQAVLDQLRQLFPAARISWIYASAEAGASIVVHDGKAGFPVSWLDRPIPGRPTISVDGDELVIRSPHQSAGLAGPVRTGDRVEIVGDRVHITGRRDIDEINVGGAKVSAGSVRDVLLAHPTVAWARVGARRSPLVGRVVVAEVVAAGSPDEAGLAAWCAGRLPEYAVPRRWRFLDEVPVNQTLKSDV